MWLFITTFFIFIKKFKKNHFLLSENIFFTYNSESALQKNNN